MRQPNGSAHVDWDCVHEHVKVDDPMLWTVDEINAVADISVPAAITTRDHPDGRNKGRARKGDHTPVNSHWRVIEGVEKCAIFFVNEAHAGSLVPVCLLEDLRRDTRQRRSEEPQQRRGKEHGGHVAA